MDDNAQLAFTQKPDYCFVASVASMLCDNNASALQDLIVNLYPTELQKGEEKQGVPISEDAIRKILIDFGLASSVLFCWKDSSLMLKDLKERNWDLRRVLLGTNNEPRHCMRIDDQQTGEKLYVIDPASGTSREMPDHEFHGRAPYLIILS